MNAATIFLVTAGLAPREIAAGHRIIVPYADFREYQRRRDAAKGRNAFVGSILNQHGSDGEAAS